MFSLARTGAYGPRQSQQVETKIAFNAIKVLQMSNASTFDDVEERFLNTFSQGHFSIFIQHGIVVLGATIPCLAKVDRLGEVESSS
jgi:hypothetical protein